MNFNYKLASAVTFGAGALAQVPELPAVAGQRCMLLCFPGFNAGALIENLKEKCDFLLVPDKFEENPSEEFARTMGNIVNENRIETIIAIGGGSSMDSAKASAWFASNPEWSLTEENPEPQANRIHIIAVPTTAGTGSEVTQYSILTCSDHFKRILNHASLVPNQVICDPELTLSMPPHVTAHTGIDALSHLIEAYLSKTCNGLLEDIALSSMARGVKALPRVMAAPKDLAWREEMMSSALGGGVVLAHCGTVMVHALGYCLTREFGYQHGLSNAILLSTFVELLAGKGCKRAKRVMDLFNGDIAGFVRECGVEPKFPAVSAETIDVWAQAGYDSYGRMNCVAELTFDDIKNILINSQK